jgi:hypothetical protein
MSLTKASHNFGDLKKTLFASGESPYSVWRDSQEPTESVVPPQQDVDVLELLRFNIDQLQELNSRFGFVLEELSSVLVKKKRF